MALIYYRKPQNLDPPPDETNDDPSLAYTPPPIIQQPDDLTAPPEAAEAHFSQFQPRTDGGQFDGPPAYPDEPPQQPALNRMVKTEKSAPIAPTPDTTGIDPAVAAKAGRPLNRMVRRNMMTTPLGDKEVETYPQSTLFPASRSLLSGSPPMGLQLQKHNMFQGRDGVIREIPQDHVGTQFLQSPAPQKPTPSIDDIWNLGAPDTQGIEPAVAANLRTAAAAAKDSPSTLLANAARKRGISDPWPEQEINRGLANSLDVIPGQPEQPSILKSTAPPMPNYNARIGGATVPREAIASEGGGGAPVGVTGDGPPPNLSDKRGRPIADNSITDPLARAIDYKQRLSNWEPTKAKGWRRYLPAIISGLGVAAGVAGKNEGAIAANMGNAFGYALKPDYANEQWKKKELTDTQDLIDQHLEQQKTQATIANLQSLPQSRKDAAAARKTGLDLRGERVDDLRIKAALDDYNKRDYTPGENPALDQYYADSGLHDLAPHKKDEPTQLVWSNGELLKVGKKTGEAAAVTKPGEAGGPRVAVIDPHKQANQTATITVGGQKQVINGLTPAEAARVTGSEAQRQQAAATAAANRKSREGIAAKRGDVGAGTIAQAASALSRYRAYDTRIAQEQGLYNRPAVIKGLQDEQAALGRTMRQRFPNHIDFSNGAPELVTVEGAADRWREANPGKEPTKAQIDAWQKKIDAMAGMKSGVGGSQ